MSVGIPGSRDHNQGISDQMIIIDPALHRRLALHAVEYAEEHELPLDERQNLLDMLGYPQSA